MEIVQGGKKGKTQNIAIQEAATKTTSYNTSDIDVSEFNEAAFFLDVTAVSGTSPTLDIEIKTKCPISGKYFAIATFTQATGVTTEKKGVTANLGSKIRAEITIGGTNPSFTFSLGAVFKKRG